MPVEPVMAVACFVALMVALPAPTPVINPRELKPLLTAAMFLLVELHLTALVRSCVKRPLLYVPIAWNCWVAPAAMGGGLAGSVARLVSVAVTTVRLAVPDMPAKVAVIVIGPPAVTPVATPFELVALLMAAMALFEDFQVANRVTSWCVPLSKLPVAVNCWLVLV